MMVVVARAAILLIVAVEVFSRDGTRQPEP